MATENQKRVFANVLERVRKGQKVSISAEMRKVGYSKETSKKPSKITKSLGWKELLAQIQDEPLLTRLNEIALDNKDKRANIEAIKEIFKLKDRYPKQKLAVEIFEEELSKLKEE